MKKFICMLCTLLLSMAVFGGCASEQEPSTKEESAGKVRVVCTTFPQYDWVMNLLDGVSEQVDVTLLVKNNADIHNYQPSAQDMTTLKEADLFIYVGGESDTWVSDLMKADSKLAKKSLSLSGVLLEENMLKYAEHKHEEHNHEEEHVHEYDEHVWLSLENAEVLCEYIGEEICNLMPEYTDEIQNSTAAYIGELQKLDVEYRSMVQASAGETLIFGDRFPFCYLVSDYDIEYYAAYTGCNAEIEVGFDTIIELAGRVDELESSYVMVIDGSDRSIAKTILESAKRKEVEILELDSIQSVSWEDVQNGASYLGIMKKNLEVLKKALG
ncbi:MAG: zinc ABC transporter substrate-binding protein [Lachnospiraceae bacterium]|nr:zinc ABC transporter substrate-binding protein [Lachnospiraceae bacterium]